MQDDVKVQPACDVPPLTAQSVAQRRRVLVIIFHYAPSNTSGALRTLKLVKYLADYGWGASVLTVPLAQYETIDLGLLQEQPPSARVHRAPCFDARSVFGIRGKYPALVAVPDRYVSWLPGGVCAALRLLRAHEISVVLSTSPVPTAHLIGRVVQALSGKPWIAELRDPWDHAAQRTRLRRGVERRLLAHVVRHADRVVATTPEMVDAMTAQFPRDMKRAAHVVYNGYDEDDFSGIEAPADERAAFVLTHAGLLDPDYRNPEPFLVAVQRCLQQGVLPPATRVSFLGAEGDAAVLVKQTCTRLCLGDRVQLSGRVPHRQAIEAIMAASALVLIQGGRMGAQIPAKTFEYLRSGRPLLGLVPPHSASARLLRDFAGVYLAAPDDAVAIAQRLAEIVAVCRSGAAVFDRREPLRRYSRQNTARDMVAILDDVSRTCGRRRR
jgi:glycosyltransferase involved in cell wall biosynthesis